MFDEFYNLYPRHESKGDARRKYEKVIKSKIVDHATIMSGVRKYLEYLEGSKTERKYIKLPGTWLNQECWDDEYGPTYRKRMAEIGSTQDAKEARAEDLRSTIESLRAKEKRFGVSFAEPIQKAQAQLDSLGG